MSVKVKIVCPICSKVVALTSLGLIPRHRPWWRANRMEEPVCFASGKLEIEAARARKRLPKAGRSPWRFCPGLSSEGRRRL